MSKKQFLIELDTSLTKFETELKETVHLVNVYQVKHKIRELKRILQELEAVTDETIAELERRNTN